MPGKNVVLFDGRMRILSSYCRLRSTSNRSTIALDFVPLHSEEGKEILGKPSFAIPAG